MAEAVRRFGEASGSDVVRRLIARPIRLDPPRMAASIPASTAFASASADPVDGRSEILVPEPTGDAAAFENGAVEDERFDEDFEDDVVERLHAEMAVMKAILMAERAEAASLRARIAEHAEPEPIGAEARATRERWAAMVDRLLMSPR